MFYLWLNLYEVLASCCLEAGISVAGVYHKQECSYSGIQSRLPED